MVMPNFLIIGAEKAGTTALYNYLKQHPDIYMSPMKEPKFFSPNQQGAITNIDDYHSLFQAVDQEIAIGESSPQYLNCITAPKLIKQYIPEVKIIALIRQPVVRAYSHYNMMLNLGHKYPPNFIKTFRKRMSIYQKSKRIESLKFYSFQGSFYYESLNRYLNEFHKDQFRVYLYDDFKDNNLEILKNIFEFLEVNKDFTPRISKNWNKSYVPKNAQIHQAQVELLGKPNLLKDILRWLLPDKLRKKLADKVLEITRDFRQKNLISLPDLPIKVRQEFTQVYYEDIIKVEKLLGIDLSRWLAN